VQRLRLDRGHQDYGNTPRGLGALNSLLKKSDRSVMKEEKESERGYSRIFLASLPLAANQSCVAQF
jgi:hypothetical protein